MFAKTIVLSDAFLDMPLSARCLYFTLGMFADDDGFVNGPKAIIRQCGASEDDMKVLIAKRFIIPFENGLIVIKHWRINNYLQKDRYHETKYTEERSMLTVEENGSYSSCIQRDGIPSLGKTSLGNIIDSSYEESCPGKIPDEAPAEKKIRKKPVYEHESNPYKLAMKLDEMIHANNPEAITATESTLQSWADTFRLMIERDNRTPRAIYDVMFYAQNDDFWKANILSAAALRKQYDRLRMKMEGGR